MPRGYESNLEEEFLETKYGQPLCSKKLNLSVDGKKCSVCWQQKATTMKKWEDIRIFDCGGSIVTKRAVETYKKNMTINK